MMIASILALASAASSAQAELVAFPGAEGAGRLARGGRGGRVIRVTNLDDSGPGSLRAAIEAKGARTIIFDVGGTIRLNKPLVIRHGEVTVAGQTAPGDGITVRDQAFQIAADDVVVRYLRSRLGAESQVQSDAFTISRGKRIIVDHVSASWSVDETLSASSAYRKPEDDLRDVTVQWSIIGESMRKAGHAKGQHGYGSLVRGAHGARMSWHHNLWAHHVARMPRPGNFLPPGQDPVGPVFDFRSNVFYNWGGAQSGYNADSEAKAAITTYNFVDNYYKTGPDSKKPVAFDERSPLARAWFEGNAMNGVIPADPWSLVTGTSSGDYRLTAAAPMPAITRDSAQNAYRKVLASAGASRVRDSVDQRIVESVGKGLGGLIDTQADVGGWPALRTGEPWRDSDGDGLPDDWERRHGLDPNNGADGNSDRDGDGYTALEDWLDSLARPAS